MKKALSVFLILLASFILWKCASQTTPTGGPKDETPPKLTKSVPANKQTNFKGKKVELSFDELLKLNNAKDEIIITPSPGKDVDYLVKQNKVTITPKAGWKDSTTYSISFREGIQDLNEGNSAVDLHLAFSTGQTIDSLQISGKIAESLNEQIPEKITVALYQEDTFNIFEHTPAFFTKTKTDGTFKIENLKAGAYNIYAFEDKNKNLKIESISEKFGFLPHDISPSPEQRKKKIDTLNLSVYKIDSRPLKINSIRNTGNITKVKLNKNLVAYTINNPTQVKIYHAFSDRQTEVSIYNTLEVNDSVKITIQGTDSTQFKIDSTFFIKRIESKLEKDKLSQKIVSATFNPETFEVNVKAQFSKPIKSILTDSIYITPDAVPERAPKEKPDDKKKNRKESEKQEKAETKKDTATVKPITKIAVPAKDITLDTARNTLTIKTTIDKKIITEKTKQLNLVLEQLFVLSVESDSSRREIKSIPIADDQSTGILHIEVSTKHKNYEIRLLSSSGEILKKVRNVKKYTFNYLQPQEYKLMMYVDLNDNGQWDCQNITLKTVQEPTYFYKTAEGKFSFPVRAAWELGPLILKF